MHDPVSKAELIIWTDAKQAAITEKLIVELSSCAQILALGSSRNNRDIKAIAQKHDLPANDDLRQLLVDHPATFLLVTTMTSLTRDDLSSAIDQGFIVLCLEPWAASIDDLFIESKDTTSQDRIFFLPEFRQCPGWLHATDPMETLGQAKMVNLQYMGLSKDCSLWARLIDAWRMTLELLPLATNITATLSGPLTKVPENPRSITGHLAIHAQIPNKAILTMQLSDLVPITHRQIDIITDQGLLHVTDLTYRLLNGDGTPIDQQKDYSPPCYWDLLIAACQQIITQPTAAISLPRNPQREAKVLACSLTTLLSIKTHEQENPDKWLKIKR